MANEVLLDVAEPAILRDDQQLPLPQVRGASPEQVQNIDVTTEMDHDLKLGHQRFEVVVMIGSGTRFRL